MIPHELLELREQMHEAHADYIAAWSAYTSEPIHAQTGRAVHACRTTTMLLNVALTALIRYLEPIQSHPDRAAELKRANTLLGTLHYEAGLIVKALTAGQGEAGVIINQEQRYER